MSRRDVLIAALIAIVALGLIAYAIIHANSTAIGHTISGIVRGKTSTGERETYLNVSRKGVDATPVDTGYYLKVFVADENREYEVIVERDIWEKKNIGDQMSFFRPPSQQR